jgi:hypothetical protein
MFEQNTDPTSETLKIGHVVVILREGQGYIGGYLCTNGHGVPLEFLHTSESPIKTDRLQELLYGKSLMPELFGKRIASALLSEKQGEPRTKPTVLLTEDEAILMGFDLPEILVIQVVRGAFDSTGANEQTSCLINQPSCEVLLRWRQEDTLKIKDLITKLRSIDLLEPFDRIRAVLEELYSKGSS